MSRNRRPRRPTHHDYRIGELVALSTIVEPLPAGEVVQVVGFRGAQLRLLPIGGLPVVAHFELVIRVGLPAGSERPPNRWRRRRAVRALPPPPPGPPPPSLGIGECGPRAVAIG